MARLKNLVNAALFAALIFVSIVIFNVPNGIGGIIHLGDTFIFIGATLLPAPYAMLAASVGAGLSNLALAPIWLPFTIIIKPLMAACFTSRSILIFGKARNVVAPFLAATINLLLYYIAYAVVLGGWTAPNWAGATAGIPGNLIQGGGSIALFFLISIALDRIRFKERILQANALGKNALHNNEGEL